MFREHIYQKKEGMNLLCSFSQLNPELKCGTYNGGKYEVFNLKECQATIVGHLRYWRFHGCKDEVDLILTRVGIFHEHSSSSSCLNICPSHRANLGVRWRRNSKYCKVPEPICRHAKKRITEKGLTKSQCIYIEKVSGILLQVGTGVCVDCLMQLRMLNKDEQLQSSALKQTADAARFDSDIFNTKQESDGCDDISCNSDLAVGTHKNEFSVSLPAKIYQEADNSMMFCNVKQERYSEKDMDCSTDHDLVVGTQENEVYVRLPEKHPNDTDRNKNILLSDIKQEIISESDMDSSSDVMKQEVMKREACISTDCCNVDLGVKLLEQLNGTSIQKEVHSKDWDYTKQQPCMEGCVNRSNDASEGRASFLSEQVLGEHRDTTLNKEKTQEPSYIGLPENVPDVVRNQTEINVMCSIKKEPEIVLQDFCSLSSRGIQNHVQNGSVQRNENFTDENQTSYFALSDIIISNIKTELTSDLAYSTNSETNDPHEMDKNDTSKSMKYSYTGKQNKQRELRVILTRIDDENIQTKSQPRALFSSTLVEPSTNNQVYSGISMSMQCENVKTETFYSPYPKQNGENLVYCKTWEETFNDYHRLYENGVHAVDGPVTSSSMRFDGNNHMLGQTRPPSEITRSNNYECETCGKRYKYRNGLRVHKRKHTGEKPFECETCGKRFNQISHLRRHVTIHTGDKPFECQTCGKRFKQKCALQAHVRVHTGYKPFDCEFCGKIFNSNCNLQKHVRIHTGSKPFACEICEKRFTQSCTVKVHMRIHTGDKPFECKTCDKRFNDRTTLRKHGRVHTGDRPFECETCGKRFSQKCTLKAHIRIHTGDKPFECETCGKKFNINSNLQIHRRIHTGDRPYVCQTCGKRFSQSSGRRAHMKIHTREKPFECETCGKRFNSSTTLRKHEKICSRKKRCSMKLVGRDLIRSIPT